MPTVHHVHRALHETTQAHKQAHEAALKVAREAREAQARQDQLQALLGDSEPVSDDNG